MTSGRRRRDSPHYLHQAAEPRSPRPPRHPRPVTDWLSYTFQWTKVRPTHPYVSPRLGDAYSHYYYFVNVWLSLGSLESLLLDVMCDRKTYTYGTSPQRGENLFWLGGKMILFLLC